MTVHLTPDQEKFIAERMHKEGYASPEKVLEEGFRLIQAKEEYERRLAELRREIQIGVDQINRGEVMDGEDAFRQLREKFKTPQTNR
jgi:antitoxin ParD1/3/4